MKSTNFIIMEAFRKNLVFGMDYEEIMLNTIIEVLKILKKEGRIDELV